MREYERRNDAQTQSCEATVHEKTPYNRENFDKRVAGYTPHPGEREERGEPRELFSIKNSYNDLSIGADKKGDMMVTGSAIRRHDAPTLENDEKKVEGSRRRTKPTKSGELFTNPAKPDESAFAYRVGKKMPERKILGNLREAARRHDLDKFNDTLVFLDVKQDEAALQKLRDEEAPVSQIQELEGIAAQKKTMEQRFLRQLRLARRELGSMELDELREKLFGADAKQLLAMPEPQADGDIGGEDETGENSGETEENYDIV
jgi:hypothetical protein